METNLSLTEEKINSAINPNAGIGEIKAEKHNEVLNEVLKSTGKYVGFNFSAVSRTDDIVYPGEFVFQDDSMDAENLIVSISKTTKFQEDILFVLQNLGQGSIIQFKDYKGRSVFYEFNSYSVEQDTLGNEYYSLSLSTSSSNTNYSYQNADNVDCIISFFAKQNNKPQSYVGDNSDVDNAILNGIYPIVNFPIGTLHVEKNVDWKGFYTRITETEWLRFGTLEELIIYINATKRKYVDENGVTLFEAPLSEKINLLGIKGGYDLAKGGYYLESILDSPFLSEIQPVSMLPDSTITLTFFGASFTRSTTVTSSDLNVTINSVNYELDSTFKVPTLKVNITSNSNEQEVPFTIDNGKSETYTGFFNVILGTVFIPQNSQDWTVIDGVPFFENGTYNITTYGQTSTSEYNKIFDVSKDIRFEFMWAQSPLGNIGGDSGVDIPLTIQLIDTVTDEVIFGFNNYSTGFSRPWSKNDGFGNQLIPANILTTKVTLEQINNIWQLKYNDNISRTYTDTTPNNLKLKIFNLKHTNLKNIRYVELQTV